MKESELTKLIFGWVKWALPGCWYRKNLGGLGQRKGIPDIEIMYKGIPYFIEVKVGDNKLSKWQKNEIGILRENDIKVLVAYSLEDVVEFFEGISEARVRLMDGRHE